MKTSGKREDQPVTSLIYDDSCTLCTRAVRFLQWKEGPTGMSFIPASGSDSEQLLGELGIPRELCEKSVILIQDRHVFSKSTAVIKAIQSKGRGWKIAGLLTIVPLFIRDALYDWIAGNRKRKRHEFL